MFFDVFIIYKGEWILVSIFGMVDFVIYDDFNIFDVFCFVCFRDQENMQNQVYFVSIGLFYFGFGYGKYVCFGWFFVLNELKILFCYVIIKYDFKLFEDYVLKCCDVGIQKQFDLVFCMMFVLWDLEIDFDVLDG